MNSLNFKENICRICLKHGANVNWNDEILEFCGISYKDCYYKYTNLKENDVASYPTSLCEKCAEELKTSHMLLEKAIESFKILQNMDVKCFDVEVGIKSEIDASDEFNLDDKTLIRTEENPIPMTLHARETNSKSEDSLCVSNKIEIGEVGIVDPTHFIDIQNFKSSVEEVPFAENFDELCDIELPKSKIAKRTRRKKVDIILPTSMEQQNEVSDTQTTNIKKTTKRNKSNVLSTDELCKKSVDDCKNNEIEVKEVGSNDETSLENFETDSTKPSKKSREKYLLMCSYCSLKVEGAKKLEIHEARHNENRERKVTCPECGIKLYTALDLHMKIHQANRQKEHKCEFCEKAFFNKGALNVHRRIHLGLMIKCKICEKEFYRQVDLAKHLLKHSSSPLEKNVGKKKYVAQCRYCNKSILTDQLKEHIAIHMNQPQVKCKICDKDFYCRRKCTNHLRRFHLKKLSEYEDYIHYYVDRNKRLSNLMIKQQLTVQPLK